MTTNNGAARKPGGRPRCLSAADTGACSPRRRSPLSASPSGSVVIEKDSSSGDSSSRERTFDLLIKYRDSFSVDDGGGGFSGGGNRGRRLSDPFHLLRILTAEEREAIFKVEDVGKVDQDEGGDDNNAVHPGKVRSLSRSRLRRRRSTSLSQCVYKLYIRTEHLLLGAYLPCTMCVCPFLACVTGEGNSESEKAFGERKKSSSVYYNHMRCLSKFA